MGRLEGLGVLSVLALEEAEILEAFGEVLSKEMRLLCGEKTVERYRFLGRLERG